MLLYRDPPIAPVYALALATTAIFRSRYHHDMLGPEHDKRLENILSSYENWSLSTLMCKPENWEFPYMM